MEILTRFIVNTNGRLAFSFVKKLLILKWNKFKEISGAPLELNKKKQNACVFKPYTFKSQLPK